PELFGFYIDDKDIYLPISTHGIEVDEEVEDLANFAKQYGISYKLLKYFNPWLRQNYLKNKKKKTYIIKIPNSPYNTTHEKIVLGRNGIITNN
ncbi:MAG: lytic transglycosylase domain-containing protein, partial [Bacteroidales bacterium]|nr:lytic transglycosylase domain-containing protein [Bacteroidales bacterium]